MTQSNEIKVFGINTLYFSEVPVYTILIRVNVTPFNQEILIHGLNRPLSPYSNVNIKYVSKKIEISFITLNKEQFEKVAKAVGNVLKRIAQNNLNNKYQWTLL
jgi:hypothetical protein